MSAEHSLENLNCSTRTPAEWFDLRPVGMTSEVPTWSCVRHEITYYGDRNIQRSLSMLGFSVPEPRRIVLMWVSHHITWGCRHIFSIVKTSQFQSHWKNSLSTKAFLIVILSFLSTVRDESSACWTSQRTPPFNSDFGWSLVQRQTREVSFVHPCDTYNMNITLLHKSCSRVPVDIARGQCFKTKAEFSVSYPALVWHMLHVDLHRDCKQLECNLERVFLEPKFGSCSLWTNFFGFLGFSKIGRLSCFRKNEHF